jgi:pyruvate,water dikinase
VAIYGALERAKPRRGKEGEVMSEYVRWFEDLGKGDVLAAGGKGANLGEMTRAGLPVPSGFVLTAAAYRAFLDQAGLREEINGRIADLDVDDRGALEAAARAIQARIRASAIPESVRRELGAAYGELVRRAEIPGPLVAVRSSATMEDTESASFAGMNRSFLNVRGAAALEEQVKEVWASLFSPRVIFYRRRLERLDEPEIAVIVQLMVNSAKSGVAFSMNPTTGDDRSLVIEAAFGLGEVVVGGQVEPDHYEVAKADLRLQAVHLGQKPFLLTRDETGENIRVELPPERAGGRVLTDAEVRAVAELVLRDEAHYGVPQDVEFAIEDGRTYLVQSRPITGMRAGAARPEPAAGHKELVRGLPASPGRASGAVKVARTPDEADKLEVGDILVAPMTSPDWVPFMRRAAAIVTDSGGMTSHAAIVSREIGLPCIVGARRATTVLEDGMIVTVDASAGVVLEGRVAAPGPAPREAAPSGPAIRAEAATRTATATRLMVNLGEPEMAAAIAARPVDGVGLLRAEFMLLSAFQGVHPRRLLAQGRGEEFVGRMVEQLRVFAQAFHPRPVIYRSTDFRTNEFRGLEGGEEFEPHEENPMIGLRGAYRYVRDPDLFRHELEVLRRVRADFANLHLMIPFVRTGSELERCKELVDASGLSHDRHFQLWVMAEVPSVVHWLEAYARLGIAGVSIGSNDLTQLVLGVDRDNETLAPIFDERDPAVTATIHAIIRECRRLGLHSSICGQAPSVYPEYAETLIRFGIDSISVNPDVIDQTRYNIAAAEQRMLLETHRESDPKGDDRC